MNFDKKYKVTIKKKTETNERRKEVRKIKDNDVVFISKEKIKDKVIY